MLVSNKGRENTHTATMPDRHFLTNLQREILLSLGNMSEQELEQHHNQTIEKLNLHRLAGQIHVSDPAARLDRHEKRRAIETIILIEAAKSRLGLWARAWVRIKLAFLYAEKKGL